MRKLFTSMFCIVTFFFFSQNAISQAPTITCPPDQTITIPLGQCTGVIPAATVTGSPAPFVFYMWTNGNLTGSGAAIPPGVWTVNVSASNSLGVARCSFQLTVLDITPPTITCPSNRTANTRSDECGALVLYTVSAGDCIFNVGGTTVVSRIHLTNSLGFSDDIISGGSVTVVDQFDLGVTPVTFTATDAYGNTSTCSFTVTVEDHTPPFIFGCFENVTATTPRSASDCGTNVNFSKTASDACGPVTMSYSIPSGSFFRVGSTPVTATATDGAGNSSSCTFQVVVTDGTKPIINCPGKQTLYSTADKCTVPVPDFSYLASDNCALQTVVHSPIVGYELGLGTHTVRVTAVDQSGNFTDCDIEVEVKDNIPPIITCRPDITVNADQDKCAASASKITLLTPAVADNCHPAPDGPRPPRRSDGLSLSADYPVGTTTLTWTALDISFNTATCVQTVTVIDNQPPTISSISVDPGILWPPNHQMKNVTVNYTSNDNCGITTCRLEVSSNEPINGTGDGDTSPDWEVIDDHNVKLRAERAANGDGRVYTITIICADEHGNETRETINVIVAHNITAPHSGQSFRIGSTVSFSGTFWDKPGNKHSSTWVIDDNTAVKGSITEPSGSKNGRSTGSYKFTNPGVYKLQMNIRDQNGVITYANTSGDLEAIVVIYDPNGGNTYGGGYFNSPAGALKSDLTATGKASYGFAMNYFKNSTYPKGETQFEFKVGDFEFNALNFDYLAINNSTAQFKGTGKIIGGQSGVGFTMTVVDGQLDGSGVDKIRMKIYNKNNGSIIYDNQPGASDAALPTQAVGTNSTIVISGINATQSNITQKAEMEAAPEKASIGLELTAYPNPTTNDFSVIVQTNTKEKITMQVVDMYGRVIEARNVYANSIVKFGDRYRPGTYFIRVIQGKQNKELRLIKL